MRIRATLMLGMAFALFLAPCLAEQPVRWTVTGAVTSLGRDMDTGILEGSIGMCGGKGTFGDHSCNTFVRQRLVGFDTTKCPGLPEFQFEVYSHVQKFANGELLYQRLKAGGTNYMCVDPFVTNSYWGAITTEFAGGTGKFESATGDVEWEIVRGDILNYDPVTGLGAFSGIVTELDGHISLNKN